MAIIGQQPRAITIAENALQELANVENKMDRIIPLIGLAQATVMTQSYDACDLAAWELIDISNDYNDDWWQIGAYVYLGLGAIGRSQLTLAKEYMSTCLEIAEHYGDPFGQGVALRTLGGIAYASENYAATESHLRRAVPLLQQSGQSYMLAFTRRSLGMTYLQLNDLMRAKTQLASSLVLELRDGLVKSALQTFRCVATVYQREGHLKKAVTLLTMIETHPQTTGKLQCEIEENLRQCKAEMDAKDYETAVADSESLALKTALKSMIFEEGISVAQ